MSQRRFTDKPDIDPGNVMELAPSHAAMVENRTLFPTTVVTVTATTPDRLLVSGENNRKLGKTVEKGAFKGYAIYQFSLEERATCPADCDVRAQCYGNSMQLARRHRIGDADVFYARMEEEIRSLARQNIGVLVRLHVLGDFLSLDYVAFWSDILSEIPNVACYGYTHRLFTALDGDEIGDAIDSMKAQFGDRFRIRWSFPDIFVDGAMVIEHQPAGPVIEDDVTGLVCPAQIDATACCATCALCWSTADNCILFLKHGRRVAPVPTPPPSHPPVLQPADAALRRIAAVPLGKGVEPAATHGAPEIRWVAPTDLMVEASYQRNLSKKSNRLIQKIVAEWDWARFKPPAVAETADGLFVIDGQHTAIAAASHGGVRQIPVIISAADLVEQRAAAFVAHNRDRVAMTPFDLFHAQVAAGDVAHVAVAAIVRETGCAVPRSQPLANYAKPGQISAVNEIVAIYRGAGAKTLRRLLTIVARAKLTPVTSKPLRALRRMFENKEAYGWADAYSDEQIAAAMASIPGIDLAARTHAAKTGQDVQRACIMLIRDALQGRAA